MKKIISLLLALTCVCAFFSCSKETKATGFDGFVDVVASSAPTKITTVYSYEDIVNGNTLTGKFETVMYDDNFHMNYNYQNYADPTDPEADPKNPIKNNVGVVYYKDGKYSEDGQTWFTLAPNELTLQVKLNLTKDNLENYKIKEHNTVLTANVTSEKAKEILGVDVNATEDGVNIQISHDGTHIREVLVSYSTENADLVSYQTRYIYEPQTSPWDVAE